MDIKFGKTIAEKLGLKARVGEETDRAAAGLDMLRVAEKRDAYWAAHQLGLTKNQRGGRGITERPTGYGRRVRRQRNQDTDSSRRKARARQFKITKDYEAQLDTAAQLARLYFELEPCRPEVHERIVDRVDAQARNLADTEDVTFNDALAQVEKNMLDNLSQFEKRKVARERAQLAAGKQRQIDALKARIDQRQSMVDLAQSRIDERTGHPVIG